MNIFSKHRRKFLISGMVAVELVFLLGMAHAHGINVFAWVEGDTVHAQAKLSDGRKAQNAPITVYNNRGVKLLEGKTDAKGDFSFPVPGKSDLKIVLSTGTGHRAEWVIVAAEIERQTTNETTKSRPSPSVAAAKTAPDTKTEETRSAETISINPAELQIMIETALEKKLKPAMKMLVALQNRRPTFKDIMGGMGYIFGLVGVAAYFRYRPKKDPKSNDDQ